MVKIENYGAWKPDLSIEVDFIVKNDYLQSVTAQQCSYLTYRPQTQSSQSAD